MNPTDEQLRRLFRAARPAGSAPTVPPWGLETQALTAWRAARSGEESLWDIRLLTRALAVALMLAALSFWPVLHKANDPFTAYLQVDDSTSATEVTP